MVYFMTFQIKKIIKFAESYGLVDVHKLNNQLSQININLHENLFNFCESLIVTAINILLNPEEIDLLKLEEVLYKENMLYSNFNNFQVINEY